MPDWALGCVFGAAAAVSLATSWLLVSRLERVGKRFGLSEALLGMLAALAADAPEITAAVTALAGHEPSIGAGVVIGSNVFNLAALLGVSAVIAGRISLHRPVIMMEGTVAMLIAGICVAAVTGALSAGVALGASGVVMVPYLVVLGLSVGGLARRPGRWSRWLARAVAEEESELQPAIHPRPGGRRDEVVAVAAVLIVVGASVVMERTASTLGTRHAVAPIIVGGLVLAGVTSLPNAVAALYLARRGRGAATLSTALNSNALNVVVGLLIPATIVGLGAPSGEGTLVAAWYLGLTALTLAFAYRWRGLRRVHGGVIIGAYAAFVGVLLATS